MIFSKTHTPAETGTVLREALDRRTPLVLSFREPSGWITLSSRLLGVDGNNAQLTVELPAEQRQQLTDQLPKGSYIGVAFRRGHKKCLCTCVVTGLTDKRSGRNGPAGLTLRWPKQIQVLQRRNYYRVPVPANMELKALIWSGGLDQKPENPAQDKTSMYARIQDISLGGMAVHAPAHENCPFNEGQTVACEFSTPDNARITIEAQFRHATQKPNGKKMLGFQFVGLEHGPTGQHRIKQIVELTKQLAHRNGPPFRRDLPRRRQSV
ncbi:MAG: PilZ domain-containing protein [Phycisphaerales bacterium]|nr:MAG: PilZ domain-containing protein [Phycisphaerales bacterium]